MPITNKTTTGWLETFKTKYLGYSSTLFMTGAAAGDPLQGILTKDVGALSARDTRETLKVGFGGSVAVSQVPTARHANHIEPVYDSYNIYAKLELDRKTMLASRDRQGAYIDSLKSEVDNKVTNCARVSAMLDYNDGTSVLGRWVGVATGTAAAPIVTMNLVVSGTNPYGFRPFYFEEDDEVEVESDIGGTPTFQTGRWRITAVNQLTGAITLARVSGSVDLTSAGTFGSGKYHNLVLAGGSNLDTTNPFYSVGARRAPMGLLGVQNFTSSTLYGVTYQRRFASRVTAAGGGGLTPDLLINESQDFYRYTGKPVSHIIVSYTQMKVLLNLHESKKSYDMGSCEGVTGKGAPNVVMSFPSLKLVTASGIVQLVASRFLREDVVVLLNSEKHRKMYIEEFGWFDEDGAVLSRVGSGTSFEALYGGYTENAFHPFHISFISGLATP